MLFCLKPKYIKGQEQFKIVKWMRGCLSYGHYVKCDADCIAFIKDVFDAGAAAEDKEMLRCRKDVFDIPNDLMCRLTHVDASSYTMDALIVLSTIPAAFVLENVREMDVYKAMIRAYTKDERYGNLYRYLYKRVFEQGAITPYQAGGYGDMPNRLATLDRDVYAGQVPLKSLTIFDRDTDSSVDYDKKKNCLFELFLNKNNDKVMESDVYSLNQPHYNWHMWYKRTIENYFPYKQFKNVGCIIRKDYDRNSPDDYLSVTKKYSGYNKNLLCKLTKGMTVLDYEKSLRHFDVGGEDMSELQLFLFKVMKIV